MSDSQIFFNYMFNLMERKIINNDKPLALVEGLLCAKSFKSVSTNIVNPHRNPMRMDTIIISISQIRKQRPRETNVPEVVQLLFEKLGLKSRKSSSRALLLP